MSNQSEFKEYAWYKHYDAGVPRHIPYHGEDLFTLLKQKATEKPQVPALMFFGKATSYKDLYEKITRCMVSLHQLGIRKGDKVALLLPNCPQYVISYYAILGVGATVVPVNPLSTETELAFLFKDAGVRLAIALDLLAGRLEKVRDTLRREGLTGILEHTFYTSLREELPFPLNVLYPLKNKLSPEAKKRIQGARRFKELQQSPVTGLPPAKWDVEQDLAVLLYTGGTTGKPKGVMLSQKNLVVNAYQCRSWIDFNDHDRILAVLPIFHGFGMSVCMNASLISGGTCILLPRFSVDDMLKAIQRYRPTIFAGVPTMYIGMLNHDNFSKYDLSSLRGCFVGAAPLPLEVKEQFEKITGGRLLEGYGLTEAVTAICCNPFKGINKSGSIGIPFADTVITVRDIETGTRDLPPGEIGELVIQGPTLMLGYYNRPEETQEALRGGWLYTGDLGYMDEDGYFYIVDRKKDLIITGGFNVYPKEVEDVLYRHPAVAEACVIGVPDDYAGEKVKAFVKLKEGAAATEQEIIAFCREHLTRYKVPKEVELVEDLPKSPIGKILKKELRQRQRIPS